MGFLPSTVSVQLILEPMAPYHPYNHQPPNQPGPPAAKTLLKPIPLRPVRSTWVFSSQNELVVEPMNLKNTLQGTNISHLRKRKIIFKMPFFGDMLVPWRVCSPKLWLHLPQVEEDDKKCLKPPPRKSPSFSSGIQLRRNFPKGDLCRTEMVAQFLLDVLPS